MEIEVFTWQDFDDAVEYLVHELADLFFVGIYGIPRGGLPLAVSLSHRLNIPLLPTRVLADTLVVDDISDTGRTLRPYRGCVIATIHRVPGTKVEPDFYFRCREADWVRYPWETE